MSIYIYPLPLNAERSVISSAYSILPACGRPFERRENYLNEKSKNSVFFSSPEMERIFLYRKYIIKLKFSKEL